VEAYITGDNEMRFLAETNDRTGHIYEIDTAHDEFTPQALRTALGTVDPTVGMYGTVISGMMGRTRCVLVTKSTLGQIRIEVYLRRSGLIG